ncbi:tetratricopeptide repeat-containing sensor histidine kinase [Flavobacterium proteolyticum]|uniref:Sensor histidine kinase n=1 Tax=Flavobacterium proteolyticum TaxID=2911683 RepID=A0ABR9WPI9_9FLAO|nr:sensor histidine kinase [Flavobacterium proteolyticum]MBE9575836.1 sensor histidine kinase [Flavobacterium proteolyticum]
MKQVITLFSFFILIGCNSNEDKAINQKKLDAYFENSSNVNLDKATRLKFIDSIEQLIENSNYSDSLRIKNYFKIANRYFGVLEYEKYKEITNKVLEISKSNKDSLNIARAEYYLGDYYFSTSKNDSAYYYYLEAEKKYENLNDKPNLASTKLHKAYILSYEKDFIGSEIETIKVLNVAKEIKDQELIYECFANLGRSLSGLGNYEQALEYHQKSLSQIKEIENDNYKPLLQAQAINNIGFVYLSLGKFKEASEIFTEGLKINNLKEIQPVLYTSLLDNYAYSRFKINKNEGLKEFKEALELGDEIDDIYSKINIRIHLVEYYLSKNDTTVSLQYNEEANRLAKESNYNKEVLQTLDFFTTLKPKEGLKYAKEYIKISDSLQRQERLTRNKLARIEFETDEIIVEKEAISNRFRIILISSLLIISFGILFYIILYQRSKHRELLFSQEQQMANEEIYKLMLDKQDELEEAKKKEQLRISQDLHDNILNKLASIRFNLFALTQKPDETVIKRSIEYIDKIQSVESEIRTVAHELNFESFLNKGNYKSILEQLLQNQKETYQTICDYTISSDEAIESLSALVKMNIYRIIQETLNNINKHSKATLISITLTIDEGFLYLYIIDNGVGFKVSKLKSGIGLKNMESRAVSINGRLKISSEINKGTKVSLKVKL